MHAGAIPNRSRDGNDRLIHQASNDAGKSAFHAGHRDHAVGPLYGLQPGKQPVQPLTPTSKTRSTQAPKYSATWAASSATGISAVPAVQTAMQPAFAFPSCSIFSILDVSSYCTCAYLLLISSYCSLDALVPKDFPFFLIQLPKIARRCASAFPHRTRLPGNRSVSSCGYPAWHTPDPQKAGVSRRLRLPQGQFAFFNFPVSRVSP